MPIEPGLGAIGDERGVRPALPPIAPERRQFLKIGTPFRSEQRSQKTLDHPREGRCPPRGRDGERQRTAAQHRRRMEIRAFRIILAMNEDAILARLPRQSVPRQGRFIGNEDEARRPPFARTREVPAKPRPRLLRKDLARSLAMNPEIGRPRLIERAEPRQRLLPLADEEDRNPGKIEGERQHQDASRNSASRASRDSASRAPRDSEPPASRSRVAPTR